LTLESEESFRSIICKALLTARFQSNLLGMLWLLIINAGGACLGNFTMEEETCSKKIVCLIPQLNLLTMFDHALKFIFFLLNSTFGHSKNIT
jgi:hypothetical protein